MTVESNNSLKIQFFNQCEAKPVAPGTRDFPALLSMEFWFVRRAVCSNCGSSAGLITLELVFSGYVKALLFKRTTFQGYCYAK